MIKAIIFDLDGTLLDTLDDLKDAANKALACFNLPARTREDARIAIGNGTIVLMKRLAGLDLQEETQKEIHKKFIEFYSKNYKDTTYAYDGIKEVLKALKEKGYILSVLSNKDDNRTKDLISSIFPETFDFVQGAYHDHPKKPDPYLTNKLLNEMKVKKEETLYIGDTNVDMQTANNAGLSYILVTYGYRTKEELEVMCPNSFKVDTPEILLKEILSR